MNRGLLVFFDIDNTLIQSSRGHVEALLLSIAEVYGLEARIDVINHHGMTDQEIITRILEKYEIDRATIGPRSNLISVATGGYSILVMPPRICRPAGKPVLCRLVSQPACLQPIN